jgi:tetratricopeptide (TPR) repeat protein
VPSPDSDAQVSYPKTASEALAAAESHFAEGRPGAAIQMLEPFLPEMQGSLERRARSLLARAYLMNPESSRQAEAEYLRLIQLDATDVEAPLALGKFYQERGLVARARGMFERVLRIQPDHRAALAELASLGSTSEHSEPTSLLGKLMRRH